LAEGVGVGGEMIFLPGYPKKLFGMLLITVFSPELIVQCVSRWFFVICRLYCMGSRLNADESASERSALQERFCSDETEKARIL
jgi:hypothetical protein